MSIISLRLWPWRLSSAPYFLHLIFRWELPQEYQLCLLCPDIVWVTLTESCWISFNSFLLSQSKNNDNAFSRSNMWWLAAHRTRNSRLGLPALVTFFAMPISNALDSCSSPMFTCRTSQIIASLVSFWFCLLWGQFWDKWYIVHVLTTLYTYTHTHTHIHTHKDQTAHTHTHTHTHTNTD